jgi:hypothetical protein
MNEDELQRLIDDHYLGEAQTLTTGAEENLLKLADLRGRMNATQAARWDEIKRGFARLQRLGGSDDPASKVMAELSVVSDRIADIAKAIASHATAAAAAPMAVVLPSAPVVEASVPDLSPYLAKLDETLRALRIPIAAEPAPAQPSATREQYLLNDTLIPLLRFMAHRFRGYRAVTDPRVKQAIARLETVETLDGLVAALENISVSALATLTDEKPRETR